MNEEKLINLFEQKLLPLMKEHFPTGFEMEKRFDHIDEKLEELTFSAKALDIVLEQYPIEWIQRLEKHTGLSTYAFKNRAED
ncbi:MAG: hypothetical protein JWL80_381 [Parcubacteria group bacterium]|nr:hypothetical protein [Parcubacteria group bacterium]